MPAGAPLSLSTNRERVTPKLLVEREITAPVDICLPDGRLNPAAVGWSRFPHHRANLGGWGRNKRFEYWCIIAPDVVVSANISHHDYRANLSATAVDRETGISAGKGVNLWLPPVNMLGDPTCGVPMRAEAPGLCLRLEPNAAGTRLVAETADMRFDLQAYTPAGRESMGVLVPWSPRRFQYTRKDNCIPVEGLVETSGRQYRLGAGTALALYDHGRGRWPYDTRWNWGAGSGYSDGRQLGINIGGKWTDGTPSSENFVRIDGRINKISEHLAWHYDPKNWLAPWRVAGTRVDLTFTPNQHQRHLFDRWVVMARADHCFGHFNGTVVADDGTLVPVRQIFGMIEEVQRRW